MSNYAPAILDAPATDFSKPSENSFLKSFDLTYRIRRLELLSMEMRDNCLIFDQKHREATAFIENLSRKHRIIERKMEDEVATSLRNGGTVPDALNQMIMHSKPVSLLSKELVNYLEKVGIWSALKTIYLDFDSYDLQLFSDGALDAVEPARVDVLRMSPLDTRTTESAGGPLMDPMARLFGTRLGHFGAFLDERARVNDFIWGRIDAADQLSRLVGRMSGGDDLPDPEPFVRTILSEEDPEALKTIEGGAFPLDFKALGQHLSLNLKPKKRAIQDLVPTALRCVIPPAGYGLLFRRRRLLLVASVLPLLTPGLLLFRGSRPTIEPNDFRTSAALLATLCFSLMFGLTVKLTHVEPNAEGIRSEQAPPNAHVNSSGERYTRWASVVFALLTCVSLLCVLGSRIQLGSGSSLALSVASFVLLTGALALSAVSGVLAAGFAFAIWYAKRSLWRGLTR